MKGGALGSRLAQHRTVASRRTLPVSVRHIRKVAAVEEQDTAAAASGGLANAPAAVQHSPEEQALALAAAAEEARLAELDETQEELLSWMLFESAEGQAADLDRDIDYDDFGDEEYADIFEEVRPMALRMRLCGRMGLGGRPGRPDCRDCPACNAAAPAPAPLALHWARSPAR
jgi:hypothetical protein